MLHIIACKTLGISLLKYMDLILLISVLQKKKKKTEVQLESLTNIDMLLMVEEQIRAGIRQAIYRYAKANTK